jgi:type IV pilus assembly protein PilW
MTARAHSRSSARGFGLIELMIGLAIGVLTMLATVQVLAVAEGHRRANAAGQDAQVAGALGLFGLQREVEMAGYGIASSLDALGCGLQARHAGTLVGSFPAALVPALVTQGANGAPDTVQLLSSAGASARYAVPIRAIPPYYNPAAQDPGGAAFNVSVASSLGVKKGDLVANVLGAGQPCEVFEVTADPTLGKLPREDNAGWNANGFPSAALVQGSFVVNLGTLRARRFTVAGNTLAVSDYDLATRDWGAPAGLQAGVVNLQALYGKDTDGDGRVDTFDTVTPTSNAGWLQVQALRLAVVARSPQYERSIVTDNADPSLDGELWWDVGSGRGARVVGSVGCLSGSQCLKLKVDFNGNDQWKHYRYKVFDTVVPLRNMVWSSEKAS